VVLKLIYCKLNCYDLRRDLMLKRFVGTRRIEMSFKDLNKTKLVVCNDSKKDMDNEDE